jgi:hypothetical protein
VLGCPVGWENSGRACYAIIGEKKVWSEADADCKLRGGSLATINLPEEQSFLEALILDRE